MVVVIDGKRWEMNRTKYIEETEHAVKQLFEGIVYYSRMLEEMPNPVFVSDTPFKDKESWEREFNKWQEEHRQEIEKSLEKSREYLGLSFSKATLGGSILQIASMGIELCSSNTQIPSCCTSFVKPKQKAIKHCIGREVRGLPIGIIIYAARNQYNHWDDPKPHHITQTVFEFLACNHDYGRVRDSAFDLSNPNVRIYSHNILNLLGWKSYEKYEKDIRAII